MITAEHLIFNVVTVQNSMFIFAVLTFVSMLMTWKPFVLIPMQTGIWDFRVRFSLLWMQTTEQWFYTNWRSISQSDISLPLVWHPWWVECLRKNLLHSMAIASNAGDNAETDTEHKYKSNYFNILTLVTLLLSYLQIWNVISLHIWQEYSFQFQLFS